MKKQYYTINYLLSLYMPFKYRIEDQSPADVHTYIKKSKLPGAGKGLFASEKIAKNQDICQYIGVHVPMYLVDLNYYDSDYLFQSPNETYAIDASDQFSCYGRYANDSLSKMKINAKFSKVLGEDGAVLKSIRDIKKNEEIYVSYGVGYWRDEPDRLASLPQEEQDFITSGRLAEYIDSIHVESDSEEEDEEDEDYEEEQYDSDR